MPVNPRKPFDAETNPRTYSKFMTRKDIEIIMATNPSYKDIIDFILCDPPGMTKDDMFNLLSAVHELHNPAGTAI